MKAYTKYLIVLVSIWVATSERGFASDVSSPSKCSGQQTYTADHRPIETCWSEEWSARVSPECAANARCGALALARLAKRRPVTLSAAELSGGKNPGSVLCARIKGAVVLARGSHGEELTFCQASDRTLIDCNALANAYQSPK